MDDTQAPVSRTSKGLNHKNTLVPRGICLVYVQLRDDTTDQILANTEYVLRGLQRKTTIGGSTDENGVLRHEYLRDDHYELECKGIVEPIETYYMIEMDEYAAEPWILRLRS